MVFKKYLFVLPVILITTIFLISCDDTKKANTDIFYVELVNFTNDSLRNQVSENLFGKVSFYKNSKLQIVSANYITENFPDMHYFKNANEIDINIKQGLKKIRVEFGGNYTADSISYSLQKYTFNDKKWVKTSDMGFIKSTNTYQKAKEFAIVEFTKQIINNIVVYTYN